VSGFADETLEQDVLDSNDAFLAKPFLLRELAAKIRSLLREAKSIWYTGTDQIRAS
jgi:DNA-binding response OmpR family regulator